MDANRLGRGEMIAAASAVALLIIMWLFDWFGNDFGGANAWESFGFIDIVLLITIIVAIGLAVMSANATEPNLPVAGSAIVAGLGILSVLLILFRIIDPPDFGVAGSAIDEAQALGIETEGVEIGRKIGVFLGLIAAGGVAYGGFLAMQEEGTSYRDPAPRRDQGPPPGGGAPPAV